VGAGAWERYRRAIAGVPLPAALVDLDAFDANAARLLDLARQGGKTLRVATKSLRTPALVRRFRELGADTARGLMVYAATEAAFLAAQGFDDLLLAYPTLQGSDVDLLAGVAKTGKIVSTAVDAPEQLDALAAAAGRAGVRARVTLDVDVAFHAAGLSLGVRRSPLRELEDVLALADRIAREPRLLLDGLLTYEAQIAGVPDASPFHPWLNPAKRAMKRASAPQVARLRREIVAALGARGISLRLVNGGGTGSLAISTRDPSLTEVTAGSGLLDSRLFDWFHGLTLRPAAYFALQAVRRPRADTVVCHGGGWVASGETGPDKLPVPALPEGCRLLPLEGAGEVQTPVLLPKGVRVELGEAIFFRHAKAGELAEHVNELLLVCGDRVVDRAPTYRGLGKTFLG
jgi:D-serine deaminase-like pyridoxal phosphate-dependent protein